MRNNFSRALLHNAIALSQLAIFFARLFSDGPVNTARQHFDSLTVEEKRAAVRRLARQGFGDYAIAAAAHLAVEQVRLVLAEHSRSTTQTLSKLQK
jgi:hypothetical protein